MPALFSAIKGGERRVEFNPTGLATNSSEYQIPLSGNATDTFGAPTGETYDLTAGLGVLGSYVDIIQDFNVRLKDAGTLGGTAIIRAAARIGIPGGGTVPVLYVRCGSTAAPGTNDGFLSIIVEQAHSLTR